MARLYSKSRIYQIPYDDNYNLVSVAQLLSIYHDSSKQNLLNADIESGRA